MRPTDIAVRGLKSWNDFSINLQPLTVLQGPNGVGKTALIQALRLGILGYDPETGKQLMQTRKLMDQEVGFLEVGISFDNGFGIRRRFSDKTQTQVMPSRGEDTNADCQARIDEETGGLVIALDLGEFLNLSDEKRREWFFNHLPHDKEVLDWKTFTTWTAAKEGLEKVVLNLWENSVQTAPNPVIGLGNAIEVAHKDALEAERDRQTQEKVVNRADENFRTAEAPPEISEQQVEDARERVATLNQRIGQARAGREAADTIRKRASAQRDGLASKERQHTSSGEVLEGFKARLEEAGAPPDAKEMKKAHSEKAAVITEMEKKGRAAVGIVKEKEATIRMVKYLISLIEDRGPCPYADLGCQTDLKGIKEEKLALLRSDLEEAGTEFQEAKGEEDRIFAELALEKKAIGELAEQISYAHRQTEEIGILRNQIADRETRVKEWAEQIDLARGALKEVEEEEKGIDANDGGAALYEERDTAEGDVRQLQTGLSAMAAYRSKQGAIRTEKDFLEEKEKKEEALKELDGNLRRLRSHVIQRMIEPLHQEADQILRAIDPHKKWRFIFERENRGTMDFGFEEDGHLRLFNAASKGERVMLSIAFLGALLTILKPAMRLLIIDDVEQLWWENRQRLLVALAGLKDRWDAIIVAGACAFSSAEDHGWKVFDLAKLACEDVPGSTAPAA